MDNSLKPIAKKLLLIEDEFYIRDLYKEILEHAGFEVDLASDGKEGLERSKLIPNLILLDIMLPKLNGLDVLKFIKGDPTTAQIPVLLITNLGQEDVIKEAFRLGAAGYLLKINLEADDLINLVNKYLVDPTFKMDVNTLTFD